MKRWSFGTGALVAATMILPVSLAAQDGWDDGTGGEGGWDDGTGDEGGFDFGEDEGFDFGEDEGFVFEEEEAPVIAAPNTPVARYLQEGIQYYEAGDWLSASVFFWRVVSEPDISADALRPRAQYELAKTLVKLQVLQGALFYFDEIIAAGSAHPYFEASAPWLVVIARRLPGDVEMLRRVAAFADLFPDRIEEKYRDEMAFLLGQHFYNVGELQLALRYLGFVTEVSEYFPRALFLSGVTHVRRYEAEPALARFSRLLRETERDRGQDETRRLRDLTVLTMARTYYSAGDYANALDYYGRIRQQSDYWLDALFEASWAHFQRDEFNRALGNLHSLNSPFFNDEYYPEAPILQAVNFFSNCRFDEVRATLDEFALVYPPLREELELTLESLGDNTAYFEFLVELREQRGRRFDPKLQQIVNAALDDRTIRNALDFVAQLDRELRYIETADPGWNNSDLARMLYNEIDVVRALSIGEAGAMVRTRLENIRDELRQKERDASAILIETDLAEANRLRSGASDEFFLGQTDQADEQAAFDQIRWRFDGEYWKDELGYYYYHITSACR